MTRTTQFVALLAAWLLLAFGSGCTTREAVSAQAGQPPGGSPVVVRTLSAQRSVLRRTTTQPASVYAFYEAEVFAKASGYLEVLNVDIGQVVAAGEVLAVIAVPEMVKSHQKQEAMVRRLQADERRAVAQITVAQATVESAKAALESTRADVSSTDAQLKADGIELERLSGLVENRAVAERLRDESLGRYESAQATKLSAEAAVVSAGANLGVAEAQLVASHADLDASRARTEVAAKELEELEALMAYATLRSPFNGTVTERNADPGDLIRNAPASGRDSPPLFIIAQTDKLRVRAAVPERDAPWANPGDPATITFQAVPGAAFSGELSRTAGSLDQSTRTMVVEVDVDNSQGRLLPGMFGQATITLEERENVLVLPASAIRHDEVGSSYVYVVDQAGRAQVVDVAIGLDDGETIEIISGLTGAERVVDAMIGRLQPGQEVRAQDK